MPRQYKVVMDAIAKGKELASIKEQEAVAKKELSSIEKTMTPDQKGKYKLAKQRHFAS